MPQIDLAQLTSWVNDKFLSIPNPYLSLLCSDHIRLRKPISRSNKHTEITGFPPWHMILSHLMMLASVAFFYCKISTNKRSILSVILLFITSSLDQPLCKIIQTSDEFNLPVQFRSQEINGDLLNTLKDATSPLVKFNTNSCRLVLDCSVSSTSSPFATYYVKGACKKLLGVTISGIVS